MSGAATVHLSMADLKTLLNLPDGWHVTGAAQDMETGGIVFRLSGPSQNFAGPIAQRVEPQRFKSPALVLQWNALGGWQAGTPN